MLNVNNCETRDVLSNPVGDASISFVSRNPLSGPDIESTCKDDISEIDRPSAAAVTGVSIMSSSPSSSRVLCVILETSLFTASAQQSFKISLRETRLLNCGNKPAASLLRLTSVTNNQGVPDTYGGLVHIEEVQKNVQLHSEIKYLLNSYNL